MNWEDAKKWAEEANKDRVGRGYAEVIWSWDCGLRPNFDGPLLSIISRFYLCNSSRFYLCKEGDIFDGSICLYIKGERIYRKEFSSRHIEYIKNDAEKYEAQLVKNLTRLLTSKEGAWVFVETDDVE